MYKVEFFLLKSSCVLTSHRKSRRNCSELGLVRAARAGNVKLGRLGVGLDVGALLGVRRSLVVDVCAQIGEVSARSRERCKAGRRNALGLEDCNARPWEKRKRKKDWRQRGMVSRPPRYPARPRTSGS